MGKNPYDRRYRQARATLLANNPPCHWCLIEGRGQVPATTADHEPPLHVAGRPHLNLVPACRKCNYGRGNKKPNEVNPSREW